MSDVAMGAEATPLEDADGGAVDDGALDDAVAADAAATLPNLHCDGGTPIVVCLQVYILEAKCFDDPNILALACDESVLDTGNNVAYATQTCEINLERLERSCE